MFKAILTFLATTIATAVGRKVKEKIRSRKVPAYESCASEDCDVCFEDEDKAGA